MSTWSDVNPCHTLLLRDRAEDVKRGVFQAGTPEPVLALRSVGPRGGPGMPDWGMFPIPRKVLERGVREMVRISDARMSATCMLDVARESFVERPERVAPPCAWGRI